MTINYAVWLLDTAHYYDIHRYRYHLLETTSCFATRWRASTATRCHLTMRYARTRTRKQRWARAELPAAGLFPILTVPTFIPHYHRFAVTLALPAALLRYRSGGCRALRCRDHLRCHLHPVLHSVALPAFAISLVRDATLPHPAAFSPYDCLHLRCIRCCCSCDYLLFSCRCLHSFDGGPFCYRISFTVTILYTFILRWHSAFTIHSSSLFCCSILFCYIYIPTNCLSLIFIFINSVITLLFWYISFSAFGTWWWCGLSIPCILSLTLTSHFLWQIILCVASCHRHISSFWLSNTAGNILSCDTSAVQMQISQQCILSGNIL